MNNNYHESYYDNDEAIEAIYYYFELIKEKQAEIEPIEDEIDELEQIIQGKNNAINEIIECIFNTAEDFDISDEKLREIEKEMDYKL
jgi:peptidoglycan hydrolase CwlO-like protein